MPIRFNTLYFLPNEFRLPPPSAYCGMTNIAPVMTATIRLLMVEDDEADAALILASLKSRGMEIWHHRVWSRAGLASALAQEPWDLVLCDYNMPQFDALSALAMVKAHDPDTPFIIVSGAIGEETAVAAMRSGAQDFVMKQSLGRLGAVIGRELADADIKRSARLAAHNLQANEALLNSIVNTAADGIVVVNPDGTLEFANQAIANMTGHKAHELNDMPIRQLLITGTDDSNFWEQRFASASSAVGDSADLQIHARCRNGNTTPVEIRTSRMKINNRPRLTVVIRDISERTRSAERMWRLTHFDELSGLPNRLLFRQLLEQALREASRDSKPIAVLFIDLDRFKLINDTAGHDNGDEVLRQVTRRLQECLRESTLISRFSGDEFVVLMRDINDPEMARAAASRVLAALALPYNLGGENYHLSASIGISTYPSDSADATALLRNAEMAMYRAKDQGKNNFQFHSLQMNARATEYVELERALRRAVEQDELLVHYQPKVEVTSRRVVGAEALLRWQQPGAGMISPDKFITLAEETGLIVPIGRMVLIRACTEAKRWQDAGAHGFQIAVNLSPRQFMQSDLVTDVRQILRDAGLAPEFLELEITENMVMNNPLRAADILRELRAIGVHLAIDDFGTGYSSLSYLKRFPVNTIKIDRSFIKDLPDDADDAAITNAVIAMGCSLRLQVVAEGVETAAQAEFLRTHGCDLMQGYLISRPIAAEDFGRFLEQQAQQ